MGNELSAVFVQDRQPALGEFKVTHENHSD